MGKILSLSIPVGVTELVTLSHSDLVRVTVTSSSGFDLADKFVWVVYISIT